MIKLIDLLNEAPIGTYTTIGDFKKGAFLSVRLKGSCGKTAWFKKHCHQGKALVDY